MKILLVGRGKMGRLLKETALAAGDEVLDMLGSDDLCKLESMEKADVVIDFSRPEALPALCDYVRRTGTPLLSGTTGTFKLWSMPKKSVSGSSHSSTRPKGTSTGILGCSSRMLFSASWVNMVKQGSRRGSEVRMYSPAISRGDPSSDRKAYRSFRFGSVFFHS